MAYTVITKGRPPYNTNSFLKARDFFNRKASIGARLRANKTKNFVTKYH